MPRWPQHPNAHDLCWDDAFRLGDFGQRVEPRVGHSDFADIGLDRAERKIRRLRRCGAGQRVEKGRFADVRQTDDAHFETHDDTPIKAARVLGVAGAKRKAQRARRS